MKIKGEYIGGKVWQCVLIPSIAIDGYMNGYSISIGWLLWVLRFEFDKKR